MTKQLKLYNRFLLLPWLCSVFALTSGLVKQKTPTQLQKKPFSWTESIVWNRSYPLTVPHATSNDTGLDPAKAGAFLGDIALRPEELEYFQSLRKSSHQQKALRKRKGGPKRKWAPPRRHRVRHSKRTRLLSLYEIYRQKTKEMEARERRRHSRRMKKKRVRRAATALPERLWPFGVIPYEIEQNFSASHKALFQQAMRHWENFTCVTFIERRPFDTNYILFTVRECGCCSFVGMRGSGVQAISIGKRCDKFGIVVHELGHVIGFWHEHTRPDRDSHVAIKAGHIEPVVVRMWVVVSKGYSLFRLARKRNVPNWVSCYMSLVTCLAFGMNIPAPTVITTFTLYGATFGKFSSAWPFVNLVLNDEMRYIRLIDASLNVTLLPGQEYNFNKMSYKEVDSLGEPYDFASIMHYASNTFSKDESKDTIEPIMSKNARNKPRIGQRVRLSQGDIRQANKLYRCSACGRTLQDSEGSFQSPQLETDAFDKVVDRKPTRCQWRISGTMGEKISLNISFVDMISSRDCALEYLEIRDGVYEGSPLLGRYCGQIDEEIILQSTDNRVWVEYKSAVTPRGKGFKIDYAIHCGGKINKDEGLLSSPNYPDMYKPNKKCVWLITVPENYTIAVIFQAFEVELHDRCLYDFVEIRDGHDEKASKSLARLCGYDLADNAIQSDSNKITVKFVSDGSVHKSGFVAKFIKEYDECATDGHGCEQICVNTMGSYRCECKIGFELSADGKKCENTCGGYIRASNGTLSSPNYPEIYPKSKTCIWQIVAPHNYHITMNFTHFDLEGNNVIGLQDCGYDQVAIKDGLQSGAQPHTVLCGQTRPELITSRSNKITVEFRSDNTVQKTGFMLFFVADRDECEEENGGCQHICKNLLGSYECSCHNGYTLHENRHDCKEGGCKYEISTPSGYIKSPKWPDSYPARKNCMWYFTTTPGHRLKIKFEKFELEPHQECTYDHIELFDGISVKNRSLGRFCGATPPHAIETSSNKLAIVFFSDASVQTTGFRAQYSTVCGGPLVATKVPRQFFSHAKYGDQAYARGMRCWWLIEAAHAGHVVRLQFSAFELEQDQHCGYDRLQVWDGADELAPSLGKFCGNQLPPELVSSTRYMKIELRTDETIDHKGFAAVYSQVLVKNGGGRGDGDDEKGTQIRPDKGEHRIITHTQQQQRGKG